MTTKRLQRLWIPWFWRNYYKIKTIGLFSGENTRHSATMQRVVRVVTVEVREMPMKPRGLAMTG